MVKGRHRKRLINPGGAAIGAYMTMTTLLGDMRRWLYEDALPFWQAHGVDKKYGGFVEELDFKGADAAIPFKRVRVTCRQVYSFAHASILDWKEGQALIPHGAEYLVTKAWAKQSGGFVRRLERNGDVLDPTPDLYDNAFALFAFAYAYKATGETAYRDWTLKTFDWIDANLRCKDSEGFWHEKPPSGLRLQNPHMHLLEACLAAYDATSETAFRDCAKELTTLFERRLFQAKTGTLTEYFQEDWSPAPGEDGAIVEPGHQLEWAWILHNAESVLNLDADDAIRKLIGSSEKHGINEKTGAVMNRITNTGAPIDAGSRTWPNTERLKAAVALLERSDDTGAGMIAHTGRLLLDRYLSSKGGVDIPAGGLIDAFDGNARPTAKHMPGSMLYHLLLSFAEVLRISKKLDP